MAQLTPKEVLEKPLLRMKPTTEDFQRFNQELDSLNRKLNPNETEEHNKALIRDFLLDSFYRGHNEINTSGDIDDAIYDGNSSSFHVAVLMEAKSPSNKSEFPTKNNLNCKAMQETVLYFMKERCIKENTAIKYILITNGYEWFVFDARDYQQYFYENSQLKTLTVEYLENRSIYKTTKQYYEQIALPHIEKVKAELNYVYFDIRDAKSQRARMDIYKFLSPYHLLKQPIKYTDSNALNKEFYNELLHIIGLEEVKEKTKLVIKRKSESRRDDNSLLEATLYRLEMIPNTGKASFEMALNLVITWVNRILFLKLLESQLISYHPKESRDAYAFLSIDKIRDYGELNALFFMVLARPINERSNRVKEKYNNVPYLNSSLFEMTKNEQTICIDALEKGGTMPTYKQTVLKDQKGKRLQTKLDTLEYLFRFLDAYDFGAEQGDSLTQDKSKTLINASVLGLIFEKINGYKDGSFFTPGIITQYMCHETITSAVLQKFNERKGWNCENIIQLRNKIDDRKEANDIINSLTICDPAVGSGHFLVSALNEIIAIKSQLGVLLDSNGYWLKEWKITIDNDELCICDGEGELFHYNPKSVDSQRVQETLFNEKRYLIEHCLFGVDLNPNSVNICRLRLWIELLKNAFYRADGQLETLPNIDINIKYGDSLCAKYAMDDNIKQALKTAGITIDAYRSAIDRYRNAHSKQEKAEMMQLIEQIKQHLTNALQSGSSIQIKLRKLSLEYDKLFGGTLFGENINYSKKDIRHKEKLETQINSINQQIADIKTNKLHEHALEWRFEFPEVLGEDGTFIGFDIVIGNPPYGVDLPQNQKTLYKTKFDDVHMRTPETYNYFISMGLRLIRQEGKLSYIVPNTLLSQNEYAKTRNLLIQQNTLHTIVNLGENVFKEADVPTCIVMLNHREHEEYLIHYADYKSVENKDIIFGTGFQDIANKELMQVPGQVIGVDAQSSFLLAKIQNNSTSVDVIADEMAAGISTGCNDAFCLSEDKVKESKIEPNILRPLLIGRDIDKYQLCWKNEVIIYTTKTTDITAYPNAKQYISPYKDKLDKRRETKNGLIPWWALNWPRYEELFQGEKIIMRQTSDSIRAVYDADNYYVLNSIHVLRLKKDCGYSYKFILGILDSKLNNFVYQNISQEKGRAFAEVKPINVRKLRVPTLDKDQQPIISLVDRILAAKRVDPEADTSDLENQIDELVYDLYDLTEPEKEIIRKS